MPLAFSGRVPAKRGLDEEDLYGRIWFRRPHRLAWLGHGPFKPATGVRIPLGVLPHQVSAKAEEIESEQSVFPHQCQVGFCIVYSPEMP